MSESPWWKSSRQTERRNFGRQRWRTTMPLRQFKGRFLLIVSLGSQIGDCLLVGG
jgi:hypothetical protein